MKILKVDFVDIQVSDEDYLFALNEPLRVLEGSHSSRLITYPEGNITRYLHVEVAKRAGLDVSQTIDHIDCDFRNNQRTNLRPASKSQQQRNKKKPKNNTSGFKGVSRCKQTGRWAAKIWVQDCVLHLGRHLTPEAAAHHYDHFARFYHGDFARLNFPKPGEQQA